MAVKSLNRIRMELLAECFGISAFTAFVGVFFLRGAFPVEPEMYFSIVMTVIVVLASTGIAQVLGNERWLHPVAGWLNSVSGQGQASDPKRTWLTSLRLLLFFIAVWVVVTVLLLSVRKVVFLSVAKCLVIASIGLASGVVFFAGWLITQRRMKSADAKAQPPGEIADAFLRFPLRSATLSLGLWLYGGVAIYLSLYYLVGLSAFTSYCTLTLAFSTGMLAFPLQYLLFKRTLDPLVQRFAAQNPDVLQDTKLFALSLRYKLLVYSWH